LGDGGQTAVLDLGGVQRDRVLGELEALLDERGELTDAAALLAEDLLCVGGADDDVGDGGRDADLDAGVALLGQLALEELVQLSIEDTVWAELATSCFEIVAIRVLFSKSPSRITERVHRTSNELSPLGTAHC
jgi:hypothetical protein